jgi:ribosomal protein S18 acetylase RimI-like enzyme
MPVIVRRATLADVPAMVRVDIASRQASHRGILPAEALTALEANAGQQTAAWARRLEEQAPLGVAAYVAEDETGQVVGYVIGGPPLVDGRPSATPPAATASPGAPQPGQSSEADPATLARAAGGLYLLFVLPGHQRRGIGRRLVVAMADHLAGLGYRSMRLWALTDYHPARRFYEHLGGQVVVPAEPKPIRDCGVTRDCTLYYWPDLSTLLARDTR